jgi:hypothetical protein
MPSFAPRESPGKLLLASFLSSEIDGHPIKVRIPASGQRSTLCSTPEPIAQEVEPVPSSHLYLLHPSDSESTAQEEPTEGRSKEKEGQEEVKMQDCKDKYLEKETTVSALTSSPDSHDVPRSHSPAGVLIWNKPTQVGQCSVTHFQAVPWYQRNTLMTTINPAV